MKNFFSLKNFFLQNFDFSSFPLCFVYPRTFLFPQKEAIKARNVEGEVESFFVFSLLYRCIILGLLVNFILARARRHFWSHRNIVIFGGFAFFFVFRVYSERNAKKCAFGRRDSCRYSREPTFQSSSEGLRKVFF